MDPVTIATLAVTLLVPYVKKAAEEFAGEAGKAVFNKVGALFAVLKQHVGGDTAGRDTISRFEESPERYRPFLEDVLKEKLDADEKFRSEVARLLAEIRDAGPDVKIVQKIKKADSATGLEARQLTGGSVSVSQEIEDARNVTGVKIDRIGR